jgi:hypothetical protein
VDLLASLEKHIPDVPDVKLPVMEISNLLKFLKLKVPDVPELADLHQWIANIPKEALPVVSIPEVLFVLNYHGNEILSKFFYCWNDIVVKIELK